MRPNILIKSIAVIFAMGVLSLQPLLACGPSFDSYIFTFTLHPDYPFTRFAQGELGIIQPDYARSYLVVAYRILINKPLSADEVKSAQNVWATRTDDSYDDGSDSIDSQKTWLTLRNTVPDLSPAKNVGVDKELNQAYFINCNDDAFLTAANTLKDRIKTNGLTSPEVKIWTQNQDAIFNACSENVDEAQLKSIGTTQEAQADYAYQRAALTFYDTKFSEAQDQFDVIARDTSSPWHLMARYLSARALVRQASLTTKDETEAKPLYSKAETQLKAILSDPQTTTIQPDAEKLRVMAQYHAEPEVSLDRLSTQLQHVDNPNFKQDLIDYTFLLDRLLEEDPYDPTLPEYAKLPVSLQHDTMTDWIVTMQASGEGAFKHAYEQWQATKSLPWLVAALTRAPEALSNEQRDALMSAAQSVPADSPAHWMALYHQYRLQIAAGEGKTVHPMLNTLLASLPDNNTMPVSTQNLFQTQALHLVTSLHEMMIRAVQMPLGETWREDELLDNASDTEKKTISTKQFSPLGAQLINTRLPLNMMLTAATASNLPLALKQSLLQVVWVRAVVLKQDKLAQKAAKNLYAIDPALKTLLHHYLIARSSSARLFVASYIVLKAPGLKLTVDSDQIRDLEITSLDDYRRNWWCFDQSDENENVDPEDLPAKKKPLAFPAFVIPSQQTQVLHKQMILDHIDPATSVLGGPVLSWARNHPRDPLVPEALSLLVKSPRFTCSNALSGDTSHAAFNWLHRHYPRSTWTQQTPYWYD